MSQASVPSSQDRSNGYAGQRWLVEERDACGVGFIADQQGRNSHDLMEKALTALTCLEHRGGCSADQDSGDGAGLMAAIPWEILEQWASKQGKALTPNRIGVGMVFLPQDSAIATAVKEIAEKILAEEELTLLGWRSVPIKPEILGVQARENQPHIEQVIVNSTLSGEALERKLYLTRKRIHRILVEQAKAGFDE
ncbi:MAG TPA: glutamate synthase subunit alpha, partial [Leptolyngbya sp.]|nr:glutamate synthase subunit alpha [Leptolyngbya sp.]